MSAPVEPVEVAALLAAPPVRHDGWRTCGCSYHRAMQAAADYDGPTPDDTDDLED